MSNMPKIKINQKAVAGAEWTPFVQMEVPEEMTKTTGVMVSVKNNLYTVLIRNSKTAMFADPRGQPLEIAHLILSHNDMSDREIPFEDLMRIKNELCSPKAEAVQIYPMEARRIETKKTHLWVLPPGAIFPIGLWPKESGVGSPKLGEATDAPPVEAPADEAGKTVEESKPQEAEKPADPAAEEAAAKELAEMREKMLKKE